MKHYLALPPGAPTQPRRCKGTPKGRPEFKSSCTPKTAGSTGSDGERDMDERNQTGIGAVTPYPELPNLGNWTHGHLVIDISSMEEPLPYQSPRPAKLSVHLALASPGQDGRRQLYPLPHGTHVVSQDYFLRWRFLKL